MCIYENWSMWNCEKMCLCENVIYIIDKVSMKYLCENLTLFMWLIMWSCENKYQFDQLIVFGISKKSSVFKFYKYNRIICLHWHNFQRKKKQVDHTFDI